MLALKSLSITPGSNTYLSQEQQEPGTVNDGFRDLKAGLAVDYRDREWTEYGRGDGAGTGGTDYSCSYGSASSLAVGAGNLEDAYHEGRQVRVTGTLTGTLYGTITSATYDSFSDATVVVMDLDGTIQSETGLRIWVSTLRADGRAFPIAAIEGRAIHMDGELLTEPRLSDYSERRKTLSIVAGAVAWDIAADGNVGYLKLTENVTSLTITNWVGNPNCGSVSLFVQQDSTGGRTMTGYPAAVIWFGTTAPTITATAHAVDMIVLTTLDGGANIVGNYVQGALFAAAIG